MFIKNKDNKLDINDLKTGNNKNYKYWEKIFSQEQMESIISKRKKYFILLGNGINYFFDIERYYKFDDLENNLKKTIFYSILEAIKDYGKNLWFDIMEISERINLYIDENNSANYVDSGKIYLNWQQSEKNKNFLDYNGEDSYFGETKEIPPEYKNFEYWLRRIKGLIGLLEQLEEICEPEQIHSYPKEMDWVWFLKGDNIEIFTHKVFENILSECYKISEKCNNFNLIDEYDLKIWFKYYDKICQTLKFLNHLKIYYENSVLKSLLIEDKNSSYQINYEKFNTFIDYSSKIFTLNYDLMMEKYSSERKKEICIEHLHGKFHELYDKDVINNFESEDFDKIKIEGNLCLEGFYFEKTDKCKESYEKLFGELVKVKNVIIFGVDTRGDLQILHYFFKKIIETDNYKLRIYFGIFVDKSEQVDSKIFELINLIKSFYKNSWDYSSNSFFGLSENEEKMIKNIDKALETLYFYDSNIFGNSFK
ncbi:hypothetical protein LT336_00694 [Spiroplasma sp. JKS002671]|uniref:hypothetical protein n=1 Tax=Spiroplasma attinicola TaxID=2904537 RepID=UPI002022B6A4|nr:hypothetical protein [Spiroplasma sp. JKS002671]MCL8210950.1 hypothetical protein [Spiroplasma sp. JKS002671]